MILTTWLTQTYPLDQVNDTAGRAQLSLGCRWDAALPYGRVRSCDLSTVEGVAAARDAISRRVPIVMRGATGVRSAGSADKDSANGSSAAGLLLGESLAASLGSLEGTCSSTSSL